MTWIDISQRSHTNGQQVCEQVLSIMNHQGESEREEKIGKEKKGIYD